MRGASLTPPALAVVAAAALTGCGGGGGGSDEPSPAEDVVAGAGCRQGERPPHTAERRRDPPATLLDPARRYDVVLETSCGSFTIRLDVNASPKTTASFASLTRSRFFDNTGFHRIVPGFAFQGGDPTGTGKGGPGYSTVEPPPPATRYTAGVVAMAKNPRERAGTGGSQFFVVTAQRASLRPQFALLGRVVRGLQVTRRIGELGDRQTGGRGIPTQVVLIDTARLRISGGHAGHGGEAPPKGRRGRLSCGPGDACPEG